MTLSPRDMSAGAVSGNISTGLLGASAIDACAAKVRGGCPMHHDPPRQADAV